ncbi:MAG TPA: SapC family protein [Burkholderiales bacterium]|nr:SapC family protein [Burkholderiales bacterium]
MEIKPPYGYQEIVPLTKQHRVVLPEGGKLPLVFRSLAALPLSFTEFAVACRDYPIAFLSAADGGGFIPMVVLGLENQQNLFVTSDGSWENGAYIPAYVRRYPFCMTKVTVDGREQAERVACVEKRAINDKGDALFDQQGEPLAGWQARQKLLFEYEADLLRSEDMCRAIGALQLFDPFTMQAVPSEGEPLAMTGMHRIAEQKLAELAPEQIKELVQKGILSRIYAHLISLNNFGRLLERRAAGAKAQKKPN